MFQYEFFDKKAYSSIEPVTEKAPDDFVRLEDVKCIRSSYWAEHCLECSEPLCYSTCAHFIERADGRCKRFEFGIRDASAEFPGFPYAANLRYRMWGKIETIVSEGALAPAAFVAMHDEWRAKSADAARRMGGLLNSKRYPIEERQAFDASKYGANEGCEPKDWAATGQFLLQAYLHDAAPATLFFEVTDGDDLVFREGIVLQPGYNQNVLNVASLFPPKVKLRAKLYPEDNAEPNITYLFCEFVELQPEVLERLGLKKPADAKAMPKKQPAKKVKCVAWDLDNTFWSGILIESDPNKLELRPGVRELMDELDRRGIVQIIVSKNDEDDVMPVIKRLGLEEMFIGFYIGWGAKSQSIQQAADDINIGIDTFALIDDSVFERGEVGETLPMVRVYDEHVVDPTEDGCALLRLDEFDVPITSESGKRREMYRTENLRKKASASAGGSNLDFLRSCNLVVRIERPESDAVITRSHELLQRTNQLNLSGTRYSMDELLARIADAGKVSLAAFCEDRFGSYGQILYMDGAVSGGTLFIHEFVMSCRVAGKFLESALIEHLRTRFNADEIVLEGKKTDRNGLLVRTFTGIGFADESEGEAIRLVLAKDVELEHPDIVEVVDEGL